LSSGASVRLRVVYASGAPVTGVTSAGRTNRGVRDRDAAPDAAFDVITLAPGEDRLVMVRHDGRKLGKVVHVREGDDKAGPVLVTLAPLATITGRVADADGNPVPGARVRPDLLPAGSFSLSLPQVTTDQEGRFRVPDVPTGCDYALAVQSLGTIKKIRFAFSSKNITVKPGETIDVGEIRFKND
ncbi:MAG: carboxypeptidase-like regulatory domain-containing protein, partial [Isosphaerales bacterium]